MSTNSELFPAIGSVADQTEKLPVQAQTVEVTLDEERPVQEIESLCMRCEEQVCPPSITYSVPHADTSFLLTGSYSIAAHIDPVLSRGHRHVLPVRALRFLKQRSPVRRVDQT